MAMENGIFEILNNQDYEALLSYKFEKTLFDQKESLGVILDSGAALFILPSENLPNEIKKLIQ
ncbi:MAG: hypothetical protein H6581_30475 [Bacteroidia bacterium]|nr:hypothetical protein [Bacteroidia bacterium]